MEVVKVYLFVVLVVLLETTTAGLSLEDPTLSGSFPLSQHDVEIPIATSSALPVGNGEALRIVVLGASGDLSKRKTFPSLWALYREGLLPKDTLIYGLARAKYTDEQFREFITQFISKDGSLDTKLEEFKAICSYYTAASYSEEVISEFYQNQLAKSDPTSTVNYLFYLALPPNLFVSVSSAVKSAAFSKNGWNRVIIEKPFGNDYSSYEELSNSLAALLEESQMFRIDHYLGKEMLQNILYLRFSNIFFTQLWSNQFIDGVFITMEEQIGTQGRGGYFDSYGIIRDVLQNHLTQMLCLVAMEPPESMTPEKIRDSKVGVLKDVPEVLLKDIVIGQYEADAEKKNTGYKDDTGVPADSTTPTFAQAVLYVNNERWRGVPFVLRSGKALKEKKVEIRIKFKQSQYASFFNDQFNNELVIRVQPNDAVFLNIGNKIPGFSSGLTNVPLSLRYSEEFKGSYVPDAYERLILDAIRGDYSLFVRTDELSESWRIWTPILLQIDGMKGSADHILHTYEYGSDGPAKAQEQLKQIGLG